MTPLVLVTGAAGGLGRVSVQLLAARGWEVVAADLPGPALDELGGIEGVTAVALDVTDADQVEAVAARFDDTGLDAVVTFAGVLRVGSVAELPERDLTTIVEVNLLGTIRVVRGVFAALVRRRGRVVVLSSETGWQPVLPFNGAYAMTKHAVEAYADALRREAGLVGVDVVKVQPGPFRTEMTGGIRDAFARAADSSTHFAPVLRRMGPLAAKESDRARDPGVLAAAILEALTVEHPDVAYSVGPDRLRSLLARVPERLLDRLLAAGLRRLARPGR